MKALLIDADMLKKYAWSNPDIEVDGEPYISPYTVQNYAMDHPITIDSPNEWVSVEERKPEPGERALATDGAFVGEGYINIDGAWCRHTGVRWDLMGYDVTHWMPMPKPPEGGN